MNIISFGGRTYKVIATLLTRRPRHSDALLSLAVTLLVGITSQLFWANAGNSQSWAPVSGESLFQQHEYWRAFTATLVHSDWGHYLSNAFMLFILGILIVFYFGLISFPLITFFLAGLANVITVATYKPHMQLVGASGWVYVLAGMWLTSFLLIDRRRTVFQRGLRALAVTLVILMPTSFVPTTSYMAHFIGFVLGSAFGFIYFLKNRKEILKHEYYEDYSDDDEDLPPPPTKPMLWH